MHNSITKVVLNVLMLQVQVQVEANQKFDDEIHAIARLLLAVWLAISSTHQRAANEAPAKQEDNGM